MQKETLANQIRANHEAFVSHILSLTKDDFLQNPTGKWSAGQHLDHIFRSVQPVNWSMSIPAFWLRLFFGKASRPSKTYEDLVAKYLHKLEAGGRASGRFLPPPSRWEKREELVAKLRKQVESLCRKIEKTDEKQLDTVVLPHPILGKLTLREMLYFTNYHVTHHHKAVIRNLHHEE